MVMQVAVIGGGAAGLAALRRLVAKPQLFRCVAFEMAPVVGGTWVYTDKTGTDDRGIPVFSSMYRNLRTNLPKEVMAYPGYPFDADLPSFMSHQQVLQYLDNFADHFDLKKYIQFNTEVETVRPVEKEKNRWEVVTRVCGDESRESNTQYFDAVMVCNGHYSIPLIPRVPGLNEFRGQVLHSHNYRHPEDFTGLRVLLLGAAASGQDITLDVAKYAKQIYLCHRKPPIKSPLPDNVQQKPGIECFKPQGVVLTNSEEVEVDAVIFCTGYQFTFPFLSPECHLKIEDERVTPLYKHIIHTEHTTLGFIGICKTVCPFPHFDCQVQFFLASLDGSMVLPSKEAMDADLQSDFEWRLGQGMPQRYAHTMGDLQWDYNDSLAHLAKFDPIPRVIHKLYQYVHETRVTNLPGYKVCKYQLVDSDTFRVL